MCFVAAVCWIHGRARGRLTNVNGMNLSDHCPGYKRLRTGDITVVTRNNLWASPTDCVFLFFFKFQLYFHRDRVSHLVLDNTPPPTLDTGFVAEINNWIWNSINRSRRSYASLEGEVSKLAKKIFLNGWARKLRLLLIWCVVGSSGHFYMDEKWIEERKKDEKL